MGLSASRYQQTSRLTELPSEVFSTVVDILDLVSATELMSTCKNLWDPLDQHIIDLRKEHALLVLCLRYNASTCLLATRETILRNVGSGLRELDRSATPTDADLSKAVSKRSVAQIRVELRAQVKAIAWRVERYNLTIALINTRAVPAVAAMD
jgi:hypothetical protein